MSLTIARPRRKYFPHIAQSRCRLHIFSNTAFVFFDRNGRRPISLAVTDDVRGFAFAMRAVATRREVLHDLGRANVSAAVDIARSVPIEAELEKRGHRLKQVGRDLIGPCPACGGTDRFAVTPAKKVWCCRGCDKGGDVIALVQHLDGGEFLDAVQTLSGERPRREMSGQEAPARMAERERQRQRAGRTRSPR